MPGQLVDLAQPGVRLPRRIVIDTSLLVAEFRVADRLPVVPAKPRAARLFAMLRSQGSVGFLPPVVVHEVFHLAIRDLFRSALSGHHVELANALPMRRRFDWNDLYKVRPNLLDRFLAELEDLKGLLDTEALYFLQPRQLAPLLIGASYESELLRLIGRYHLDTSDAAILLDAQRAGITAIATLDADLRRAQLDFDFYTLLS